MKNWDLIIVLFIAALFVILVIKGFFVDNWFPKTPVFRIIRRTVVDNSGNQFNQYQAQFRRPFLGWYSFYANSCMQCINISNRWHNNYNECREYVDAYKSIKSLKKLSKPQTEKYLK